MTRPRFTCAGAALRLGPDAIAAADENVAAAPPARVELKEQVRAVFESARELRPTAAEAA